MCESVRRFCISVQFVKDLSLYSCLNDDILISVCHVIYICMRLQITLFCRHRMCGPFTRKSFDIFESTCPSKINVVCSHIVAIAFNCRVNRHNFNLTVNCLEKLNVCIVYSPYQRKVRRPFECATPVCRICFDE